MKPPLVGDSAAVVVFHSEGEFFLKKLILANIEYVVFDPQKDIEYRWLNIVQAVAQAPKAFGKRFFRIFLSKREAKAFLRVCKSILIANQIKKMRPKAVVTFIDNSPLFHSVCTHCKGIPFIAIQNGGRYVWCARNSRSDEDTIYHINEYYCFGPQVKRLFERYGHDIKCYVTSGSLLGGYFFNACADGELPHEFLYDICLVSQWKAHYFDILAVPNGFERFYQAITCVTELVARFAHEHGVKVCVALSQDCAAEKAFYEHYFRGNCIFHDHDLAEFSSYKLVNTSNLSVGVNSTLLSEAFGAGRKVLFVNPFNEEHLVPTELDGPWRFGGTSYEMFRGRVGELLRVNINEYKKVAGEAMADAMSYDCDRPVHFAIRQRLLELTAKEHSS